MALAAVEGKVYSGIVIEPGLPLKTSLGERKIVHKGEGRSLEKQDAWEKQRT